ncbi:hypothetical protein JQS43_09850 [Natronosporangium hydrolyticum]|uniref:Uncharacterized protein n=1 Tax=Natronosporangium hydrolyticum TaxID=2811111 RepID=A0A895YHB4_9ACTN|nr:hypothetical protein [Natronosporangium hydrolyticum]QSB17227.1 hypothetical protein JQS43_09850 [Natronosporangium hydrolyticum]
MVQVLPPVHPRKLAKVPFVELAEGRLQGVVSSGSDLARVYVSTVAAGSHNFSCRTNHNRPCGGAADDACRHLESLADEAVRQYGFDRVARYLRVTDGDPHRNLMWQLAGEREESPAAAVFSRFLHHLAYLELPGDAAPLPELAWFPATGAVR